MSTTIIGEGLHYDLEAVTIAAYLHDWGGYAKWVKPETNHAIRSRQVAEEFLTVFFIVGLWQREKSKLKHEAIWETKKCGFLHN